MVTNAALNDVLDVYLGGSTATTTWYVGLIDNSPTPTLAAGDTMASHSGWSESTAYSESTRVAWAMSAASSQQKAASAPSDFTINATPTVYGFFVASSSTKGGTSGKLYGTAAFTGGAKGPLDATTVLRVSPLATASAT